MVNSELFSELFSEFLIDLQQKGDKIAIETFKKGVDKSNMTKNQKKIIKSYIDMGADIFIENDVDKTLKESIVFSSLLNEYKTESSHER